MTEGGQFRDSVMLHMVVALVCAACAAMAIAPMAWADSPAGDQYGSALPSGGNGSSSSSGDSTGGSSGSTSGTSSGQVAVPVAPRSGSDASNTTSHRSEAGNGSKGGQSSHDSKGTGHQGSSGTESGGLVGDSSSSHSVPEIASSAAGDGWVPFFIAALVALAAAVGVLVYRNRRRTAQG